MEINVTRTYRITVDEDAFVAIDEDFRTDLLSEITYTADGGDVSGTMYLVHCYNKENPDASPHTTWTMDPEDWASEYVVVKSLAQIAFEVEDMGMNNQDA